MIYIVSSLFVLGVLIIVHEFGHFWAAKKMGVGVEKFSIGFGKAIYKKQMGETEFLVSILPLGGYVKMVGDEEDADTEPPENPELAYNNKPVWRRLIIVAAGPISNLIFAVLIFSLVYMLGVNLPDTKIKEVLKDSPAQKAGMVMGDRVVEIDGQKIEEWSDIIRIISNSAEKNLKIAVERDGGNIVYLHLTPETKTTKTIFGEDIKVGRIGIAPDSVFKRQNPITAVVMGAEKTWNIIYVTGMVVVKMFQKVVPSDTIGGPLMIFKIAGDQASQGFVPLLLFMGVLSVNLGILNLLPVPVLDGGHVLFLTIEAIKGSPISLKGREVAQQFGMVLLISLMVFAFYNDITRFLSS